MMNTLQSASIRLAFALLLTTLFAPMAVAQNMDVWPAIIGEAYLHNASYGFLRDLCDHAGGRVMGSDNSHRGMEILRRYLKDAGYEMKKESFDAPCWTRGHDEVSIEAPFHRDLRISALGYVPATPEIVADLVYARHGFLEEYDGLPVSGKIALVTSEAAPGKEGAIRSEVIALAAGKGARAVLFINDRPGGMTLSGSGNFSGKATAIPAYSVTLEDGKWMARLLENKETVRVRVVTRSEWKMAEASNLVATLPGASAKKIVIGGHFDSWDGGQGAVDNGIGSAVILEIARILKKFSPQNRYTIEFVWFDGEELGLIGAKHYAETHVHDSIGVMINMDMTGSPTGFNVMGSDELEPFFQQLCSSLNGFDLREGVISSPWTNSDHVPFMLRGIATVSPLAKLDEPMYKYYHDLGDTFDKVSKRYLSDAAAIIGIAVMELANSEHLLLRRRSDQETIRLLKKANIDTRLKHQQEWIFPEE
jgi:hypothetical protein